MDKVDKHSTSPYAVVGTVPIWKPAAASYTKYQIMEAIEAASGIVWDDMLVGGRKGDIVRARNAAYFYLHNYAKPKLSSPRVATMLRRKNHTSVLHGEAIFINDIDHNHNGVGD